jgi:hypothetical protein
MVFFDDDKLKSNMVKYLVKMQGRGLLLEAHEDQYVGIYKKEIVANCPTVPEIMKKIEEKGLKNVRVLKIPKGITAELRRMSGG